MGAIPNGNIADNSIRVFDSTLRNTKVNYSGVNFIPDGINTIEVLLPTNLDGDPVDLVKLERLYFQISISKHTIKSFTGVSSGPDGAYLAAPPSVNSGSAGGPAEAMVLEV